MSESLLPPPAAPCTEFHGFPKGETTCTVTSFSPAGISIPEKMSLHPSGGDHSNKHPIIVSLIHHKASNSYVLFDLGLSKDWKKYAPQERLESIEETFEPKVEEDVDQVLKKLGVQVDQINFIVISHSHWDHTAFPFARFPKAQVVAGPTTISHTISLSHENYSPSSHSQPLELSWSHSPTHVLTFRHSHDLFSDGSVLVVPTPGHTPGHVAVVARTSIEPGHEEYLVLAGDCAHHPFCLSNKPQEGHYRFAAWREAGEPTTGMAKHSMHEDYEEAEKSLERLKALEKRDEFMVVLAHDFKRWNAWKKDENGCVELNGWRKKGLKH